MVIKYKHKEIKIINKKIFDLFFIQVMEELPSEFLNEDEMILISKINQIKKLILQLFLINDYYYLKQMMTTMGVSVKSS